MTQKEKPTELSDVELQEAQGGARWYGKSSANLLLDGDAKDHGPVKTLKRIDKSSPL